MTAAVDYATQHQRAAGAGAGAETGADVVGPVGAETGAPDVEGDEEETGAGAGAGSTATAAAAAGTALGWIDDACRTTSFDAG
jgi:hypothetical protein